MHPIDIESTLKTMIIWTDSREQDTEQSKRRYADFGVPWERGKLDFGDYSAVVVVLRTTAHALRENLREPSKQGRAHIS